MQREFAEVIAARALGWLAANDDLLPVFLGSSGAAADDLRRLSTDPAFLVSVLDFLMVDDAWVIAFCDSESLPYDTPMMARRALPGGEEMHWT